MQTSISEYPAFSGREWLLQQYEGVIKYGLERIEKLLSLLDNPQRSFSCIHVAGTNGKGSISALTELCLRKSGYKTGLFVSPHIDDLRERIRINGRWIDEKQLDNSCMIVRKACELMTDRPSFFEKIFAVACVYFREKNVDIAVIEAGLGGRLDATNTVVADVAVISNVSADHLKTLGPTLKHVLKEKAGIIKKDTGYVVSGLRRKSYEEYVESICNNLGIPFMSASNAFKIRGVKADLSGQTVKVMASGQETQTLRFGLAGSHQRQNLSTVLGIIKCLRESGVHIPDQAVKEAAMEVKWSGRFEVVRRNPVIILDGAHNVAGARALARTLKETGVKDHVLVLGMLADKKVEKVSELLVKGCKWVAVVQPSTGRALHRLALEKTVRACGVPCQSYTRLKQALRGALKKAGDNGIVVVTGSLYLLGEVRQALNS